MMPLFWYYMLFAFALSHPEILEFKEWHNIYGHNANQYSSRKSMESRKAAFNVNIQKIKDHNAKNLSWRMGINQFSDLTGDEFSELMGFDSCSKVMNRTKRSVPQGRLQQVKNPKNAATVDYRNTNNPLGKIAVTPVKNQGACGSCWSFSATGAVEGAWIVGGNDMVPLSEQELVSCDKRDSGCNGGLMDWALDYVKDHGITSEEIYPYVSGSGNNPACDDAKAEQTVATISSYIDVDTESEDALENALNIGPVAIGIEADQYSFQSYSSGVLTAYCGTSLDHGVLAVGYGHDSDSNLDYWIVKNSWGQSWGDNGYIYLERHVSAAGGQCGILLQPSYPISGNTPSPNPGPLPTPKPTPSPGPSPSSDDYEDPGENGQLGCNDGEADVIYPYGANGRMCMPPCKKTSDCPAAPSGWNTPTCSFPYGKTDLCAFDCSDDAKYCSGGTVCTSILGALSICLYQ